MISYGRQSIDKSDIEAVTNVLLSDFLTNGLEVKRFSEDLNNKFGQDSTTTNSGTAALHLSLLSLDIKKDDEIIIPSITFSATANVIEYVGGKVVIADVEEDTLLIDIADVETKITNKTKAIIAVDMAGQLCDYAKLKKICTIYDVKLISDACHSFGATNNLAADLTCFSFHPVKSITTGEGGAIIGKKELIDRCRVLKNQGKRNGKHVDVLGYNYRMSDINAALGRSQLKRLYTFLKKRQNIFLEYQKRLLVKSLKQENFSSYHLYIIKVDNRQQVIKALSDKHIYTQIHYIPIYDLPYYKNKYNFVKLKNTEEIKNKILSIPIYPDLGKTELDFVIKEINKIIEKRF